MQNPTDRPDPAELLEAFVASDRCDKAFAALVGSLDRLVYSSALRRTGKSQLAEEVAQDVFAIMARKADSLRRHPSLTAWALKTTKLQCGNAMRSERRRQRKIAALTDEAKTRNPLTPDAMDDQATWKDAIPFLDDALDHLSPLDQKLVLERFYEEKKFWEIAEANGKSEAACKMRVQRALKKILSMLTARGVSLSGTAAVASMLGTEVARAVPAHTAAALAPNALAASPSFSTGALLANTFQTMSAAKTVTFTTAAVLAVFSIPLTQQRSEGSRLQSELDAIAGDAAGSDGRSGRGVTALSAEPRAGRAGRDQARTASYLLESLNGPANNRELIRSMTTGDALAKTAAFARINEMGPEEITALLKDVKRYPIDGFLKIGSLRTVEKLAPDQSPQGRLERLVASGMQYDWGLMRDWSRAEPDAALGWYREKRASGEFFPGLSDGVHEGLIGELLVGLAKSNPAQAFELYGEVLKEEINGAVPGQMASAFAEEIMKSGDEASLVQMLDRHSGEDRKQVLSGAFGEFARAGRFDDGMALVDRHSPDPEERADYLEYLFRNALNLDQLEGGIDWVIANTPEAQDPEVMQRMIYALAKRDRLVAQKWAKRQEPGIVRDATHAAVADRASKNSDYRGALTNVEDIADATLRAETLRLVQQRWREDERESTKRNLPAELLEQLQDQ